MADRLTKAQRSYCMSRIRSKNTGIELTIRKRLHAAGIRFRVHRNDLAGKPDISITKLKLAVFIDGDFWHGYRFKNWESKLQPYWRDKIAYNIKKDRRNRQRLRRAGWVVLRFWQHQVEEQPDNVVKEILKTVKKQRNGLRVR